MVNSANAEEPALRLRSARETVVRVLPFQNMSGDSQQDYFADGMVEDIIAGLSRPNAGHTLREAAERRFKTKSSRQLDQEAAACRSSGKSSPWVPRGGDAPFFTNSPPS
jgi:TolB-like protein